MDLVKPLKYETDELGTEVDEFPTQTDTSEDYINAKGYAFEDSKNHYIDLVDGEIAFTDPVSGTKKVSELAETGGVPVDFELDIFDAYDNTGGTNIDSGWTDVPLGTQRTTTPNISHTTPNAEIEINTSGSRIIVARVTTTVTTGTSRTESQMKLQLDTGSGYADIAGSFGTMYNRTLSQGEATATVVIGGNFNDGDKVKIQAQRVSGSSNIALLSGGSSLTTYSAPGVYRYHESALDPTTNDDASAGYLTGYIWLNTTSDEAFICVDNTTGSAVWTSITEGTTSTTDYNIDGGMADTVFVASLAVEGGGA